MSNPELLAEWEQARVERDGYRADVTITRPEKRNAMDESVIDDLCEAVRMADTTKRVRAIVLLGEGPVFCAGMDLEMMRDRKAEGATDERLPRLLETIESTQAPTVAAVKRAAPAGAFELTLPCDFRVLGDEARYGIPEVKLGTFPHGGATQRLPRLVGLSRAKQIVLSGDWLEPMEAKAMGLVHEVVEDTHVDTRARALADELCENAPLGMVNAKVALNAALETGLDEGLELERTLGRELDDTHDYHEGFNARIEDRKPEFEGR
jgi:enoyl-CoA hydratase/carnithine racemase